MGAFRAMAAVVRHYRGLAFVVAAVRRLRAGLANRSTGQAVDRPVEGRTKVSHVLP
jgi:hypothetical protein